MLRCDEGEPSWTWADVEGAKEPVDKPVRDTKGVRRVRQQVECKCAGCGEEFLKDVDQVREGRRDCCSAECRAALHRKPMMVKACPGPGCGKEHTRAGTFCSRTCANSRGPRPEDFKEKVRRSMARTIEERSRGPHAPRDQVECSCTGCDKTLWRMRSKVAGGQAMTCGRNGKCTQASRQAIQVTCDAEGCNNTFVKNPRTLKSGLTRAYCSIKCRLVAVGKQPLISKVCGGCGEPFSTNKLRQRCCSMECSYKERGQAVIATWKAGEVRIGTENVPNAIRRYLFQTHGSKCSRPGCGWGTVHPVTGKVPLTVNHINGDPTDHSFGNLELLCPNCHSLTPNYCALNKSKGRKRRYVARTMEEAVGFEPTVP